MRPLFLGIVSVSLLVILVAGAVLFGASCGDDDDSPGSSGEPAGTTRTASAAAPASPTATPGTTSPTGQATGPAEHEGARALAIVKELAKEPRVSGTAAESRAAAPRSRAAASTAGVPSGLSPGRAAAAPTAAPR